MKKILYIATLSSTINAFLVPHIEMLISKGYQVDCGCNMDMSLNRELIAKGVNIYDLSFSRNPLSINNIKAFSKLILLQRINRYDTIHAHTPVASLFGRLLKIRFPYLKIIYTAHGYHFYKYRGKRKNRVIYIIERMLSRLTDITININSEDYQVCKEEFYSKKVFLLNGVGIDLSRFTPVTIKEKYQLRKKLNLNKEDFVVIMLAEFNENKNHIQVVKAMEHIKDICPNMRIICMGPGSKRKVVEDEINKRELNRYFILEDFHENVKEYIAASDIGILLSYREGLPRSIMEYMAMGLKVVGTDIRGIRDLIENSNVGVMVPLGDDEKTAAALEFYYQRGIMKPEIPHEIYKYDMNCILKELWNIYSILE